MGEGKRGEGREKNLTASSFSFLSTVQFSQGCIYLYEQQKKKHNLKKKKNQANSDSVIHKNRVSEPLGRCAYNNMA